MSIRRYIATKDSTITNAYKKGLLSRATSANMGESDSLEVFSIYAQASSDSVELSRILLDFPIEKIKEDRELDLLPQSGSVEFVLKMSNAVHPFSLPKKYSLSVNAMSSSWDEGYGLDMDEYKDEDAVNWISSSAGQTWTTEGGDIYEHPEISQYLENGTEDLEVDITEIVEKWIKQEIVPYGVMVKLSSSMEADERSYYTKRFFSRSSEYFFKKPWIEARFDSTIKDDRGKFFIYSSYVPMEQNYNTIYVFNRFRGKLYDFPTVGETGSIAVGLYAVPSSPLPDPLEMIGGLTSVTGSWVATGVYKADVAIDTSLDTIYDVWFDENGTAIGSGGAISVLNPDEVSNFTKDGYNISIRNLKEKYHSYESARFQLTIRSAEWNPNSYSSLSSTMENEIIEDMYFKIFRIADNYEAIPYGTGSVNHTRMSFDVNGNYCDVSMNLLEPGYSYAIKFTVHNAGNWYESRQEFKFRVEE